MLTELGGTALDDEVYRYLVQVPSTSATALAEALATPRRAVTAALAALEDRGLITRRPGRPVTYLAAPPHVAGQALILRQREALLCAEADLIDLVETYRQSSAARGVAEVVEVVLDQTELRDRAARMMRGARHEFLALVTPPFKVITPQDAGRTQVHVSGMNRTVYDRRVLEEPGVAELMLPHARPDEQWRVHERVPMKLIVVDREIALLTGVHADIGPPATMVVHRSTLLDAVVGFFQFIWSEATPLPLRPEPPDPDPSTLSTEDQRLLALMLAGLTDRAIAAHLGVGHRSVQRRVRQLMDLAGVSTRTQLGWQAHKYRWLTDDEAGL